MDDYKLSLTAEEIEKKLSMCTLPMVTIADVENITDDENDALNAAFDTGLPCVIGRHHSTGSLDTVVADRYEGYEGTAEFYLNENEWFVRNKTTMKWGFVSGGE